jgi:hypothetical protein
MSAWQFESLRQRVINLRAGQNASQDRRGALALKIFNEIAFSRDEDCMYQTEEQPDGWVDTLFDLCLDRKEDEIACFFPKCEFTYALGLAD